MTFTELTCELVDMDARFVVLCRLAERFSRQPRDSWGYSSAEIETTRQAMPVITEGRAGPHIPAALVRWYETVGRVPELTATQNKLLPPDRLRRQGDVVILYIENQACAYWGIRIDDLALDDPPVIYTEDYKEDASWQAEADALSRFAMTVDLTELSFAGDGFHCSGMMDDTAIPKMRAAFRVVPVQPLRWPSPADDTLFLADEQVLVWVQEEFFFAFGTRSDITSYLDGRVAPGRIEWHS